MDNTPPPIELAFSKKYNDEHSLRYFAKHRKGITRKLSDWREQQMARKALHAAGNPKVVLDLPCGAGRFWPTLAEQSNREILAADNSQAMIDIANRMQEPEVVIRVKTFQTSAFAVELPDESVDCLFCMRLMHHVSKPEHRIAMLQEFHRVTRDTVILSLWVDGNYKSWRRKQLEEQRTDLGIVGKNQNRFVVERAAIEQEFTKAGFSVAHKEDSIPLYAMWRIYTLKKISRT